MNASVWLYQIRRDQTALYQRLGEGMNKTISATKRSQHPLAGKTVRLNLSAEADIKTGDLYHIEDWWENVAGGSWMFAEGNPAALKYAMRAAGKLPLDNEVVYGKVGSYGHLIHASELGAEVSEQN